jgi:hypothetical protein
LAASPPPPRPIDGVLAVAGLAVLVLAAVSVGFSQAEAVLGVQLVLFIVLIGAAGGAGVALASSLKTSPIGIATRRSSLTGETSWSLTPSAAYLLLLMLLAGVIFAQVASLTEPAQAASGDD